MTGPTISLDCYAKSLTYANSVSCMSSFQDSWPTKASKAPHFRFRPSTSAGAGSSKPSLTFIPCSARSPRMGSSSELPFVFWNTSSRDSLNKSGAVVPAEAGTSQPSPVMPSAAEASLGGRSLVQSIPRRSNRKWFSDSPNMNIANLLPRSVVEAKKSRISTTKSPRQSKTTFRGIGCSTGNS